MEKLPVVPGVQELTPHLTHLTSSRSAVTTPPQTHLLSGDPRDGAEFMKVSSGFGGIIRLHGITPLGNCLSSPCVGTGPGSPQEPQVSQAHDLVLLDLGFS